MADTLRKIVAVVIVLAAISVIYVRYEQTRPCASPIVYSLGSVDPRFGISQSQLLVDLKQSADIWNKAAGRSLLVYKASGGLPVNLIFDNRQQTANLGTSINATEAQYEAQKVAVDASRTQFEADQAAYNSEVEYWNARGGAPPNVYPELQAKQSALVAEQTQLNNSIAALNAAASALNATVDVYNTSAPSEFEEGLYHSSASGAGIDLYEFTSTTQLIRLAAHEFGHAIGLGHNDDPESIMYPYNQSKSLTLSVKDLAALKALCNLK